MPSQLPGSRTRVEGGKRSPAEGRQASMTNFNGRHQIAAFASFGSTDNDAWLGVVAPPWPSSHSWKRARVQQVEAKDLRQRYIAFGSVPQAGDAYRDVAR